MKNKTLLSLALFFFCLQSLFAQSAMQNPYGRDAVSLNGKWNLLPDWTCAGESRRVWEERTPAGKTDFYEYSFDGAPAVDVPGDFNSQIPEMKYSECWAWYRTVIPARVPRQTGNRLFLYFGGVNYKADVWLNGEHIGSHEGGYTPFQFEITGRLDREANSLIVRVDNRRSADAVPAEGFDWFNYGGITRDVFLVETPATYIDDYFFRLDDDRSISAEICLDGPSTGSPVVVEIPELRFRRSCVPDSSGRIAFSFRPKGLRLWSPASPKLYDVVLVNGSERITDRIGFRTVKVEGNRILVNGDDTFLKCVNFHEEALGSQSRAVDASQADELLSYARELGCNMVRLAHYPHNEHTVRLAEELGLMVWDEIPVYQGIAFDNPAVTAKIENYMAEMVKRDRNRCAVIVWSLSNETWHRTPNRTAFLSSLSDKCRALDSSRLVTHVVNSQGYIDNVFRLWDPLYKSCDFLCLNEYLGWYNPWKGEPAALSWELIEDKPVFISEFGGEAKLGSDFGPKDAAGYWSEEYQADIYRRQIEMFRSTRDFHRAHIDDPADKGINLAGVSPWILFDYVSLARMHPVYQNGYNRKGLVDEFGNRKQSFFIMQSFYRSIP